MIAGYVFVITTLLGGIITTAILAVRQHRAWKAYIAEREKMIAQRRQVLVERRHGVR